MTSLIVDDSVEQLEPGQMKKSEFLAQLRSAVMSTAEEALAGTDRSAQDCPYIGPAFEYYSAQTSEHLERALRKYAPEAAGATTARDYIPSSVRGYDKVLLPGLPPARSPTSQKRYRSVCLV
jgi:hypothetical protein